MARPMPCPPQVHNVESAAGIESESAEMAIKGCPQLPYLQKLPQIPQYLSPISPTLTRKSDTAKNSPFVFVAFVAVVKSLAAAADFNLHCNNQHQTSTCNLP